MSAALKISDETQERLGKEMLALLGGLYARSPTASEWVEQVQQFTRRFIAVADQLNRDLIAMEQPLGIVVDQLSDSEPKMATQNSSSVLSEVDFGELRRPLLALVEAPRTVVEIARGYKAAYVIEQLPPDLRVKAQSAYNNAARVAEQSLDLLGARIYQLDDILDIYAIIEGREEKGDDVPLEDYLRDTDA